MSGLEVLSTIRYVTLSDLWTVARPLDLVLFKGTSVVSSAIRFAEKIIIGNDEWSHVGLVVNTNFLDIPNGIPGKLYVLESTSSFGRQAVDVRSGKPRFGVQITDLDLVCQEYLADINAKVAICRLVNNPAVKPETDDVDEFVKYETTKNLIKSFLAFHGKDSYEYNPCILIKAFCSCFKVSSRDRYFCSELVFDIYWRLGIVNINEDPEKITPVELSALLSKGGIIEGPVYVALD